MAPRWDKKPGKGGMSGTLLAVLGTAAILAVVGLWLAAHYTLTAR